LIRRLLKISALLLAVCVLALAGWVQWGSWPDPQVEKFSGTPDAIVVLGGGIHRSHKAFQIHQRYPEVPMVVTGDGGEIIGDLLHRGVPSDLLIHEAAATSTYENASFTAPILDGRNARQIVLVTDGFHMRRALAVFRHVQPKRETIPMFFRRGKPLSQAEIAGQRRERAAALAYLVGFGINSFAP
jgi:uncharacterized SAM-binding protein YcdF (DUF218 family)